MVEKIVFKQGSNFIFSWTIFFAVMIFLIIGVYNVHAVPLNLEGWTEESLPNGWDPAPNWVVSSDGLSVTETTNTYPSFFYSDIDTTMGLQDLSVSINVSSTGGDNDLIGFALGFDPGETTNPSADFLLVDWKKESQWYSGSYSPAGLAISQVSGLPNSWPDFWDHTGSLTELQRATTLGSTGWNHNTNYDFDIDFTPTALNISVNGIQQFSLTGSFSDGRLAFYDFSQPQPTYQVSGTVPAPIPEPSTFLLLFSCLVGMVGIKKIT